MRSMRSTAAGEHSRASHRPPSDGEALLGGEVVDVELSGASTRRPPAADVASTSTSPVGSRRAAHVHGDAGGRLVVGEGVGVDVGVGDGLGVGAGPATR